MSAPYALLGRFQLESPEWYAARQNRLGGSEIAAVLGLSPYESRFSLWHRKKGLVGPQEMNPEMDWGRRLEPAVLAKYAETTDLTGSYIDPGGSFISVERPYQVANPDALLWPTNGRHLLPLKVIEVKTSPFGEGWGKGPEDVPVYYRAQCLWYLDVFGAPVADIPVLISGCDYRVYQVRYDAAEIQIMRDAAVKFLASLDANDRPDIDGHDQTYTVIKELHPEINGEKVDIDKDVAADFVEAKEELAAAEDEFFRARSTLADHMGDAHSAWCQGFKIADRRVRGDGRPYVQAVGSKQLPNPVLLRKSE
jgi:putative phage-type endonuclease